MNILFISFDADPPHMGGTSTVVNILAKEFKQKGHNVYLGYYNDSPHPSTYFKKKVKLTASNHFFFKYLHKRKPYRHYL